jgi:hypothetical protein
LPSQSDIEAVLVVAAQARLAAAQQSVVDAEAIAQ